MKARRCAWVFAGGDFASEDLPSTEMSSDDLFLCVDRGVEHCLQAGIQPNFLIGDLDSVSQEVLQNEKLLQVPRQVHPIRKAASDLELALRWLTQDPPATVVLLGVSGGRTDHMMFNWSLPLLQDWPFDLQLIDATTRAYVVTRTHKLTASATIGQTVSLLALSVAEGIATTGLHYELSNDTLSPGSTLGLSNIVEAEKMSVSVDDGTLLVMLQRE